jgi:hypothetical protein
MLAALSLSDWTIKEHYSGSSTSVPSFGFPFSMGSAKVNIMFAVSVIFKNPLWLMHLQGALPLHLFTFNQPRFLFVE